MKSPQVLLVAALLATAPAMALAHAHENYHPPCGVAAGGLPDPDETQACLASRYQPPKPKPRPVAAPAANSTVGPVDSSAPQTPSAASPQPTH